MIFLSLSLSLHIHTMFITQSNRSGRMRGINHMAWQVYVFHGRQGLVTWLKAILTASSTAAVHPGTLWNRSARRKRRTPRAAICAVSFVCSLWLYITFAARAFIRSCLAYSTEPADRNPSKHFPEGCAKQKLIQLKQYIWTRVSLQY